MAVRFHPVAEAAKGSQVSGAGLTWWAERVVRLDVVEVHGLAGLARSVRGKLDRVRQFDAFTDSVGDLVGVDADCVVQVDHGFHGVRSVADELAQLCSEQGADGLGAEDTVAGGERVVGEVDVDLGQAWPQSRVLVLGTAAGSGSGVCPVLDPSEARVEGTLGGGVERLAVVGIDAQAWVERLDWLSVDWVGLGDVTWMGCVAVSFIVRSGLVPLARPLVQQLLVV